MQPDIGFEIQTAMDEIARGVIETVTDRPGDSQAKRIARQQATAWSISSFLPCDPLEMMLAGQCVIFDHLIRDCAHDALCGQDHDIKVRATSQALAAGKMFLAQLEKLEQLRARSADQQALQPPREKTTAPIAGAGRAQAASASAMGTQQPVPVSAAARGTAAGKTDAAPAAAPTPTAGPTATPAHAKVDAPRIGDVREAAAPLSSQTFHPDQPPRMTTQPAQPDVRQAAVASATHHTPPTAGGAGSASAGSHKSPERQTQGMQTPSAVDAVGAALLRSHARGGGREADALAMLAASLAVSASPVFGGQLSPAGQQSAARQAARVKEADDLALRKSRRATRVRP